MKRLDGLAMVAAVLLGACASGPAPGLGIVAGMNRDAVIARAGPPSRSVALPAGERLQYSMQPMGQYAVMVDLDAAGRVVQVRQVLTPSEFARLDAGRWTRADVEREFGRPARMERVASWRGEVMTYRWNDGSDMFFWVFLDPDDVVRRTQQGMEFINAPDRD